MNPFPWLLCAVLLSGCTSTFTDTSKLEASIEHHFVGDELTITAQIFNRSARPVTFVRHPDFYGISVLAADRSKDEAFNFRAISFVRATREDLIVARPGKAVTFNKDYHIRRRGDGSMDVVSGSPEGADPETQFMRIRDRELQATFHYGKYPDYLPKHAWALGRNYVMAEIGAKEVFSVP